MIAICHTMIALWISFAFSSSGQSSMCAREIGKRVLSMCTKSTEKGGPQPGHQGIGRKVTWLGEGEWRRRVPLMAFEKRKNNGSCDIVAGIIGRTTDIGLAIIEFRFRLNCKMRRIISSRTSSWNVCYDSNPAKGK